MLRIVVIAIGAFITLFLGPWAVAFIYGSFAGQLNGWDAAVHLVWGLAGAFGLVGFWTWAVGRHRRSLTRRVLVTIFLCFGVGAVVPVVVVLTGGGWMSFFNNILGLAVVSGVVLATVVMIDMWLPNRSFDRSQSNTADARLGAGQ